MRIRWFGQSAFLLSGAVRVAIDPFAPARDAMRERGFRFDYPPIENVDAELVLVTHEHFDHNAVEAIGGDPQLIRSTAGTFESPLGQVVGVASEHDEVAGTKRGPNTIFVFVLDGLRVCHFGDFGQPALRREQRETIGQIDLLMLPVGGGPTVGGAPAAAIVRELRPRLVVPMRYRTESADFLEPPDEFLAACEGADVRRLGSPEFEADELLGTPERPTVALPAAPRRA
jgi:L-ascorbate metabolism protein UlaG (beta-lactamase superfamily)